MHLGGKLLALLNNMLENRSKLYTEKGGLTMKMGKILCLSLIVMAFSGFVFASGGQEAAGGRPKLAAIFPGSIQDADYNTLGYIALQDVGNKLGFDTAYSEKVAVPDAERAIREYINAGFKTIWIHGNQFNSAAYKVGDENKDVVFIVEEDARPANPRPNFWYFDRNYYTGFYALGTLAALKTSTGKIGYIGGLEIPFTHGEINAITQALVDLKKADGTAVSFEHVYVGDFNDPLKTRQAAEAMMAKGIDVIISAVNLGNFGLYSAVKEAKTPVFITTTYTSKSDQAPNNYLTSDLFNFKVPLTEALSRTLKGETGGYILLDYGPDKARYLELPIRNVTPAINERVKGVAEDVASGKIKVIKNLSEILTPEAVLQAE